MVALLPEPLVEALSWEEISGRLGYEVNGLDISILEDCVITILYSTYSSRVQIFHR